MGDENLEVTDRIGHYRALARAIFSLVSSTKSTEARDELEALAIDYDLLADVAESQGRLRVPRRNLRAGTRQAPGYWITA